MKQKVHNITYAKNICNEMTLITTKYSITVKQVNNTINSSQKTDSDTQRAADNHNVQPAHDSMHEHVDQKYPN
jgi:hypothetical protein